MSLVRRPPQTGASPAAGEEPGVEARRQLVDIHSRVELAIGHLAQRRTVHGDGAVRAVPSTPRMEGGAVRPSCRE